MKQTAAQLIENQIRSLQDQHAHYLRESEKLKDRAAFIQQYQFNLELILNQIKEQEAAEDSKKLRVAAQPD